jgi:hypothetical protein
LLRPVVPEVNRMSLTSSGSTLGIPALEISALPLAKSAHSTTPDSGVDPPSTGMRSTTFGLGVPSCASLSMPRNSPVITSAAAPLRSTTSRISGPVNRVLIGTSVAPAHNAPSAETTQCHVLGEQIATRSPRWIPSEAKNRAQPIACAWRSA